MWYPRISRPNEKVVGPAPAKCVEFVSNTSAVDTLPLATSPISCAASWLYFASGELVRLGSHHGRALALFLTATTWRKIG